MKSVLKYLLLYLGLSILGAVIMAFPALILEICLTGTVSDAEHFSDWSMCAIFLGSQLLPLFVFWKKRYADYSFIKYEDNYRPLMWLTLVWIGCTLVETVLEGFLPQMEWDIEALKDISEVSSNPLGLISVCIMAPLLEEGIFRGAIERRLLERYRNPWWGIVVSALLFALVHLNFIQGVTALILGLLLGWVYYRTRNLWLCIFIHALNNTISTVLDFIFGDINPYVASTWPLPVCLLIFAAGAAVIFFGTRRFAQSIIGNESVTVYHHHKPNVADSPVIEDQV